MYYGTCCCDAWVMLLNLVHLAIVHLNLCLAFAIFHLFVNVQFQKISILPPQKGLEFLRKEGRGFSKNRKFKEIHEV